MKNLNSIFAAYLIAWGIFLAAYGVFAVSGKSGADVEGYRDYRGVPVVGAWMWLPKYDLGVATDAVEDVVFGCVTQIGEQSANIARTSLLGAGWPVAIPGLTIDRKCGSGESAVHVAAGTVHVPAMRRNVPDVAA